MRPLTFQPVSHAYKWSPPLLMPRQFNSPATLLYFYYKLSKTSAFIWNAKLAFWATLGDNDDVIPLTL